MTSVNWISLVAAGIVVAGNLIGVLLGWETWSVASQPVLLGLSVLGLHPSFGSTTLSGRVR
jgi:hypothetical protein